MRSVIDKVVSIAVTLEQKSSSMKIVIERCC
jgi:hypothetical protein